MSKAARLISTGWLNASQRLHVRPINPVVYRESLAAEAEGELILRQISRLDAFSGYSFRT